MGGVDRDLIINLQKMLSDIFKTYVKKYENQADQANLVMLANLASEFARMVEIKQGPQGPQGPQGEAGRDGKTPKAGKDYFTPTEIEQFKALVTPVKGVDYHDCKAVKPSYASVQMDNKGVAVFGEMQGFTSDNGKLVCKGKGAKVYHVTVYSEAGGADLVIDGVKKYYMNGSAIIKLSSTIELKSTANLTIYSI